MEELVGRLTALDPDASAGLRVIAYFDSLVDSHASFEAFLRGAAILTGCPAGVYAPCQHLRMRVNESGLRQETPSATSSRSWSTLPLGYEGDEDCHVWLERRGESHGSDRMVLERLASGLRIMIERREGQLPEDESSGVEALLDPELPPGERLRAATRLKLAEDGEARAIALPPSAALPGGRTLSAVMATSAGMMRALVQPRRDSGAPQQTGLTGCQGIGPWTPVIELHQSWAQAVTALRLSTPDDPVVVADRIGSLAYLARIIDASHETPPEVLLIDEVAQHAPWALPSLEAFAVRDSVRSAAAALGVHHSTAQSRCEALEQLLGYSLRTQVGRTRLFLDLRLHRFARSHFG